MLKKEETRRWLRERLKTQASLAIAALAGMSVIGLTATLMEFTIFFLIIRVGFIPSALMSAFATLSILALIQYVTWSRMTRQLPDVEHETDLEDGRIVVRIAPTMSAVWTYAFGSLESDRTWVEILLGVLSLPQRMFSAASFTWKRQKEVQRVNIESCAAIIRLLHKEAERVELKIIAAEVQTNDLPGVIRQVSLIDGVVFLTRNPVGLSLANRLIDDIDDWKQKKTAEKAAEAPVE